MAAKIVIALSMPDLIGMPRNFTFCPVQIHFANSKLRFDRFVEVRTARIGLDEDAIGLRRFQVIAIFFLRLKANR